MTEPLIVVVDDLRTHVDPRALHLRDSASALEWLAGPHGAIDELWLDHDLGDEDTVRPVVLWLEEQVFAGRAPVIGTIYVHTANPVGAAFVLSSRLLGGHYRVARADLSSFAA